MLIIKASTNHYFTKFPCAVCRYYFDADIVIYDLYVDNFELGSICDECVNSSNKDIKHRLIESSKELKILSDEKMELSKQQIKRRGVKRIIRKTNKLWEDGLLGSSDEKVKNI